MTISFCREHSKRTGSFYTPSHIAQQIASHSIIHWLGVDETTPISDLSHSAKRTTLNRLKEVRILDPAVGDGVFLIEACACLTRLRIQLDDETDARAIPKDIAESNLFGVDVQEAAVQECKENLSNCTGADMDSENIQCGNSLIGEVRQIDEQLSEDNEAAFHWSRKFPRIFQERDGFDIIIGNPPYGNILSSQEKEYLSKHLMYDVMSGRSGSWNAAPIFIVRSSELLNEGGHFGLLLPNSILRVGQFSRTRKFIRNKLALWKVIDEGNPFDNVTLEMVSLFCANNPHVQPERISVVSRRKNLESAFTIPRKVINNRIISIYHDSLFTAIRSIGTANLISASRGRDIPSKYTSNTRSDRFRIPYATKGSSVQRYSMDQDFISYTNEWFKQDKMLAESYANEFLVATKNYPYPRCVMKPKGVVHGGGLVRISPLRENLDLRAVGLVLNSRLIRYISTRYLTNYSELTTCMNTGIMEEIPFVLPEDTSSYSHLFDNLQSLYEARDIQCSSEIENFVEALIYSSYFERSSTSIKLNEIAKDLTRKNAEQVVEYLCEEDIQELIHQVMTLPKVVNIEESPRMK